MKKITQYLIPSLIFVSIFLMFVIPALTFADTGTGTCTYYANDGTTVESTDTNSNSVECASNGGTFSATNTGTNTTTGTCTYYANDGTTVESTDTNSTATECSSNGGTFNATGTSTGASNGGLVPCATKANPSPCGFNDLLTLVNGVIHFILFDMVIPIAAIMFAYAGFELVSSGGSTEKRGIAKKVFTGTALGLIIAIAAWLIVHLILSILGWNGAWIGF